MKHFNTGGIRSRFVGTGFRLHEPRAITSTSTARTDNKPNHQDGQHSLDAVKLGEGKWSGEFRELQWLARGVYGVRRCIVEIWV